MECREVYHRAHNYWMFNLWGMNHERRAPIAREKVRTGFNALINNHSSLETSILKDDYT